MVECAYEQHVCQIACMNVRDIELVSDQSQLQAEAGSGYLMGVQASSRARPLARGWATPLAWP